MSLLYVILDQPLQVGTQSCGTNSVKMCDDNVSCDAIKTEVIEISKDPLELYETGKMILVNFSSSQVLFA